MTKRPILTFETYDDWDVAPMKAEYHVYNLPHGASLNGLPPVAFETVEAFAFRVGRTLSGSWGQRRLRRSVRTDCLSTRRAGQRWMRARC